MTEAFERPTDVDTSATDASALAADGASTDSDDAAAMAAEALDVAPDTGADTAPDPDAGAALEASPDIEPGDASLLGLIDRLGAILERSDLTELEVEAGRTTVILRKPVALASATSAPAAPAGSPTADTQPTAAGAGTADTGRGAPGTAGQSGGSPARPSVKAPLTGIWYGSPTPGSAPFIEVGRELAVGQVVGLIEAMKLFNEIKSDLAGRVVRVVPDSGTLVKAKQPLIEVEPL